MLRPLPAHLLGRSVELALHLVLWAEVEHDPSCKKFDVSFVLTEFGLCHVDSSVPRGHVMKFKRQIKTLNAYVTVT